jgi:hypothetical protein
VDADGVQASPPSPKGSALPQSEACS